ncbi:hypothetical protein [Bacillus thuringiensis]|uniref:DUF7852 domain-containing protein n=1 Tax=Bacillus thuringiensis TaxID=1428 RepID=UPI001D01E78E|nr:hypothetical protein [Bacillus thuringiensis]
MIVKTPFSIISEVCNFRRIPNINKKNQEEFVFRNEENKSRRELEAKLLNTVYNYYGEIYHFSQEDSFLKEREVSRWEMNWLRTRDGKKPS